MRSPGAGPRTTLGRWLTAGLLGRRELRERLAAEMHSGPLREDEFGLAKAACEVAVRRYFGAGHDARAVGEFAALLRERQGGTFSAGLAECEAVILDALGEPGAGLAGITQPEAFKVHCGAVALICQLLEWDEATVTDLVAGAEVAGADRAAAALGEQAARHREQGRPAQALPLDQRALEITESVHGPDHRDTAVALGSLAATYSDLGRYDEALPLERRALAIIEVALGPDHPETAGALGNLAVTYTALGRPQEALPLERRALAISEVALGPDHPSTALRLDNLGGTYLNLGRPAEALPLKLRAVAIGEATHGPDHPSTVNALGNLAAAYHELGRDDEALGAAQRAHERALRTLGAAHPMTQDLGDFVSFLRDLTGTPG